MPHNANPLAAERFRTIVADAIAGHPVGSGRGSQAAEVEDVADAFPDARFEYQTNDAGVRLRRVAVASEWEVDPLPAWMADARTDGGAA
jgi:cytochrome c1